MSKLFKKLVTVIRRVFGSAKKENAGHSASMAPIAQVSSSSLEKANAGRLALEAAQASLSRPLSPPSVSSRSANAALPALKAAERISPTAEARRTFHFGILTWDRFYEEGRSRRQRELETLRNAALVRTDRRIVSAQQFVPAVQYQLVNLAYSHLVSDTSLSARVRMKLSFRLPDLSTHAR